jgi:hypothetical protein
MIFATDPLAYFRVRLRLSEPECCIDKELREKRDLSIGVDSVKYPDKSTK